MDDLQRLLKYHIQELKQAKLLAREFMESSPPGILKVHKNRGYIEYYVQRPDQDGKTQYISKHEQQLLCDLAQKEYASKLLRKCKPIRTALENALQVYKPNSISEIYETLSQPRQELVTPYQLSDNAYIDAWYEKCKETKLKLDHEKPVELGIYTEKGESVRSKSEKILADKLDKMGIPYYYEVPLYLNGFGYVKPDYVVLNKRNRQEYYWEHLGMMSKPEYCEKNIRKIERYAQNGYVQGKNLILTFETETYPINTKMIESMIREYLI